MLRLRLFSKYTSSLEQHSTSLHQSLARRLPVELLLYIFSYLDDRCDISTLCRTSKLLREIVTPILYRSIDFEVRGKQETPGIWEPYHNLPKITENMHLWKRLTKTIQLPHLSHLVTNFKICLGPCGYNCNFKLQWRLDFSSRCSNTDAQMGRAVVELVNLQSLHITCQLCYSSGNKWHHYLLILKTRKLRDLYLQCNCGGPDDKLTHELVMTPHMLTVENLSFGETEKFNQQIVPSRMHPLEERNCLPRLKRIMSKGTRHWQPLIGKSITHLDCEWFDQLPDLLAKTSASIQYLRISPLNNDWQMSRLSLILPSIEANPSPYRCIQHLGYFEAELKETDKLISTMHPVKYLPKLVSVEVSIKTYWKVIFDREYEEDTSLVWALGKHFGIQKAYIYLNVYFNDLSWFGHLNHNIWTWKDGEWKRRTQTFDSWDLLIGRY